MENCYEIKITINRDATATDDQWTTIMSNLDKMSYKFEFDDIARMIDEVENSGNFIEFNNAKDYKAWTDKFIERGGVDILFLPTPSMIDFADPVVVSYTENKIVSVGYTQKADVRLYIQAETATVVETDF